MDLPPMLIANLSNAADIRARLRNNVVLQHLSDTEVSELEPMLAVAEYAKGATLERQGDKSVDQYFILDGILKRVVANPAGKEMILRFAAETEIETSYAAWRLETPVPFSIIAVRPVRAAKLSMRHWGEFMDRHPKVKNEFELQVMRLMSEVMAHTITLHLLDAPGRVQRFVRKHGELLERIPKKELASYLNLTPETLSRLKQRGKI
jgi:CRP-like cAMP-binding protein